MGVGSSAFAEIQNYTNTHAIRAIYARWGGSSSLEDQTVAYITLVNAYLAQANIASRLHDDWYPDDEDALRIIASGLSMLALAQETARAIISGGMPDAKDH